MDGSPPNAQRPHFPQAAEMTSLSRDQIRAVDRIAIEQFSIPGLILMENASRSAAEILCEQHPTGRVRICCGKGNNAGDGFVIARHLAIAEIELEVLLFASPDSLAGDAAAQFEIVRRLDLPWREMPPEATESDVTAALLGSDWIVDALLGTGASGPPRPPFAAAINAINTAAAGGGVRILAVDLPSGLDADSGTPSRDESGRYAPCVKADATVTFVARKRGFDQPASREFTGEVLVAGIGVPATVVDVACKIVEK